MSKQKMRNLLIPVFALLVLMGTLMISSVAEAATIKYKGKSGDINWSIDTDGHLLLQGKGDYVLAREEGGGLLTELLPWLQYYTEIKSVTVKVSEITNCSYMFANLSRATKFDLSQLNTSKVTKMESMFHSCEGVKQLDLSHFDTSKVTTIECMFSGCESLEELSISNWNVSQVTTIHDLFFDCHELEYVDLSKWNLSKFKNDYMYSRNFEYMASVKTIKTPKNCKEKVLLTSHGVWRDSTGKVYKYLPMNTSKSITLYFEPKATHFASPEYPYRDTDVLVEGCSVVIDDIHGDNLRIRHTGLIDVNGTYYYVVDGYIKFAPTLVKYRDKWYYVSGGKISKATTLVRYGSTYYYVSGGTINYSTTLVKYGNNYYYVTGGKHVKATTLVKYAGKYWYVKNGVLCKDTTLVKYNGKYYYVTGGVYKNTTTIVKYGNKYYFVYKGTVNFNYTGTYVWNGVRWKIVKGVVTGRA